MAKLGTGTTSKTLIWALLALLIVGLAGFGIGGFGGTIRSVGSVGDSEISVDSYARELTQELRVLRAQTGQSITVAQGLQLGLDQVVLGRLIDRAALDNEAARIGVSVGDEQVRTQILDIPAFRGLSGSFDREAYEATLRQNGLTVAEFETDIRRETARTLLQGSLAGAMPAPPGYAEAIVAFVAEARDITYALLTETDLETGLPVASEDDLTAYYEANPDRFTIPEARRITYAWLRPEMILDTIEIDESILRGLYDERISQFVIPERRLLERLVFPDTAAATAAKARLDAGELSFDDLVAERGLTLDDVDMGDAALDDLGSAGAEIFALEEPGVVGPLDTDLGPALFRVNAILSAQETSFDEAKADLRDEYAADRARRLVTEQIEGIDDLLAGGATLEQLADETQMVLGQIDWYPGVGEGPASYPEFRTAAAEVAPDDFPEIRELEDGSIFALRVDEIVPPRLQPFEDVRDDVEIGWESETTAAALAEQAEALAGRLQEGLQFEGLGLALQTQTGLTRDGFVQGMPEGFIDTVFGMEPGSVEVVEGFGAAILVRLDAITEADPEDPETRSILDAVGAQARQTIGQDALEFIARAIEAREGISLNQAALQAVHTQLQ